MTLLVERTVLPAERVVWLEVLPETDLVVPEVLRAVLEPVERLVVAVPEVPVERLVRVFWSTVPAERVVVEPVERLVVAADPVLRLVEPVVEVPVERLVRVFWLTVPEERVVEEPELRPVVVEPVLRVVRSFCANEEWLGAALAERLIEVPVERLAPVERLTLAVREAPVERLDETEPEDRLMEEDPRVAVCEEDDRDAEEAPPERRVWA